MVELPRRTEEVCLEGRLVHQMHWYGGTVVKRNGQTLELMGEEKQNLQDSCPLDVPLYAPPAHRRNNRYQDNQPRGF